MNIFKALSILIASTVSLMTKGLKSIENVAEMAELATGGMLEEQTLESKHNLSTMRARFGMDSDGNIISDTKAPTKPPKASK